MATTIKLRRDTAANWTSANPTLAQGEAGVETDTGKIKYGDGSTAWTSLDYFAGEAAAFDLGDADDVTITGTPADNEVLAYDSGGDWINQTAAEAGLATDDHDHDADYTPIAHASASDNPHSVTAAQAEALALDAPINAQNSTYEVQASDAGKVIEANGTFTITLPDGLDTGFQCVIMNVGSGTITLAAATTLQSKDSATLLESQYTGAAVYHRGSNVWLATGDLTSA